MFIVLEGLDGSGKSTQVEMLTKYFNDKNLKTKFIHFPETDSPVYGELVGKFLRGELGSNEQVNPYLVALIYAGDRNNSKAKIQSWLDQGYVVIADRYVMSNIAFQCAKLTGKQEQDQLAQWIMDTEFGYFNIPKPDLNIFLDVPPSFTQKQLTETRQGDDRTYLNGAKDIHEEDLDFQQKVRLVYTGQVSRDSNFKLVNCANDANEMGHPNEIFNKILPYIDELLDLQS